MKNYLVFDNYTFNNYSNFSLNCIKRWLCYNINNIFLEHNNKEIVILKTNPTISSYTIKINNIEDIINTINGILFKKYDTYSVEKFKTMLDFLNKNIDENNKITIICSISKLYYTNEDIDKINLLTSKFINKIDFINIGFRFTNKIINFNKTFIDYKINKTHEIFNVLKYYHYENELLNMNNKILYKDNFNTLEEYINF